MLDDADLVLALGHFEFGDAGFGDEVDQRLQLSQIHATSPGQELRSRQGVLERIAVAGCAQSDDRADGQIRQ